MSLVERPPFRFRWEKGILAAFAMLALTLGLSGCERLAIAALNQITTTHFEVRNDRLLMSGEINSKSLDQFEDVMARTPSIKTLVELDVPGSIDDDTMIALASRVRELGLNTHLTATSAIYSGGVDLFLAGVERTMEPGAKVGVHSWSDGSKEAKDYPQDAPEHEQNRRYIEKMLGNDRFYWFTIYAAPADDIHIMSEHEIAEYGLLTK